MLTQYSGTAFEPILKSALEKIYSRLPERVKVDLSDVKGMIKFGSGSVIPISKKLILELYNSCDHNLSMDIRY